MSMCIPSERTYLYYLGYCLLLSWLLLACGKTSPNQQPHIIFIMADDYGWANIGYHNTSNTETITPTLDSLNAEGIELDRHYAYRFCSPSRCAFLSGRNPIHVNTYNLEKNYNPANNISGYAGIPLNMTLIGEKMQQGGYSTHYTGKWDVGLATKYHLPINRGFHSAFGFLQHANDYWQYTAGCAYDLWNNSGPAFGDTNPTFCNQSNQTGCVYEDDLFAEHVLNELNTYNSSQPLFYYFAMHSVHDPLEVPEIYLNKFAFIPDIQRRYYSAMVNHMDDVVSLVVEKLKEKEMWNNTLLVFASDNGGAVHYLGGGNNYPLKGGKASNWEGGIRVNAFVSGGYLPQEVRGTKSEAFFTLWDWYATFCAFAGVDPTDFVAEKANLPPIDSYNMWPLLSGENATNPRTEIPIGADNGENGNNTSVQGIIIPPYKLVIDRLQYSFWQGPLYPNSSTNFTEISEMNYNCGTTGCLFDIISDPTEHNDISSQYPDIVKQLLERIEYYSKTVFNVDRGPPDAGTCKVAHQEYGGFFGPWVDPIF